VCMQAYNRSMARGWESKSVEAQIDMADAARAAVAAKALSPEDITELRKKETLNLSRTRAIREMKSAQNPRYKAVLTKALADLAAQLKNLKERGALRCSRLSWGCVPDGLSGCAPSAVEFGVARVCRAHP